MRHRIRPATIMLLAALALVACSGRDALRAQCATDRAPRRPPDERPIVYLSEIHYDNVGADADERIEITGPAGTDPLWLVGRASTTATAAHVYNTQTLSGTIRDVHGPTGSSS
jgi:hypothetical protein